jgi:hypothetical protein
MKKTVTVWLYTALCVGFGLGPGLAGRAWAATCDPGEAEPVAIVAITEQGEVALDDGMRVSLPGLENTEGTRQRLVASLRRLLPPGAIVLAASAGEDRWGRRAASLFLPSVSDDGAAWLQEAVLGAGDARALPGGFTAPCWRRLMLAEASARHATRGIWAEPGEGVIPASETARLMARQGRRTVVGGRLLSVGEGRSVIFLNFGRRRHGDFSVVIPRRRLKSFDAAAKKPATLIGRHLLVRGVVSGTRQPRIEAYSPDDIEISDPYDTRSVEAR